MSEYQYYEFLAIDRPLTPDEMSKLRALSTRGQITPVSFSNEYHWGDFKGSPDKLMQSFFDAHVYVAIWGTGIFMVRLPIEALAKETAEAMSMPYALHFKATKTHWIITWSLEESENYDRFGMEDGRGWMAQLAPLRDELLRGDIRSLYIGWLAGVAAEMAEDDESEPLPLSGLGSLTSAQKALAKFLELDQDLLAGAGMGSPQRQNDGLSQKERDTWIESLPPKERSAYLKKLSENSSEAWKGAQHAIERGSSQGYDEARNILVDLSAAYSLYISGDAFENALTAFMVPYLRRKALIKRLVKSSVLKDK